MNLPDQHKWPEPPMVPPRDYKNFVIGAVFGEAVGDALGHPIEGHSFGQKRYKVIDLPSDKQEENKFTDDTQMFVCIGDALLESPPHVDEDAFMVTLGKKFGEWTKNPLGGSHRAPGGNCMDACRKLRAGKHWTTTGGLDFKGNGAPMRSGIVGAYYWKNPEYAFRIGALTSVCTHNNLEALLSAGMVAYLVAAAITGANFGHAVAQGILLCEDFTHNTPFYPKQVRFGNGFSDQNPWYAVSRFGVASILGKSGWEWSSPLSEDLEKLIDRESVVVDGACVPAVAEAIYFNTRCLEFKDTVLTAVNNSDDTDTIGAIAGTIAGARYGFGNIPAKWSEKVELSAYLYNFGMKIWEASMQYVAEQKVQDAVLEEVDMDAVFSDGEDIEVEF